jgi:signal transduction histidine kinase
VTGVLSLLVSVGGWLFGYFPSNEDGLLFTLLLVVTVVMWGGVGALIGARRPENPLGLILAGESLVVGLTILLQSLAEASPGSTVEAISQDLQGLLVVMLLTTPLVLLLFPDGRPLSRRWNVVLWLLAMCAVSGVVGLGLAPDLAPEADVEWDPVASVLTSIAGVTGILVSLLSIVSVILRFRRSRGVERAQMRWLAFVAMIGGVFLVAMVAVGASSGEDEPLLGEILFTLLLSTLALGLPAAIGVAVLRYRLWDLDIVIRKTLIFAVVAGGMTLLAVGIVFALPALAIGPGLSEWERGLLLVGIVIGMFVGPLRRRARRLADRIVYGGRATPYEVLTDFSERVGETYSAEDVLPRMAGVLGEGTGAERAAVWLSIGKEMRAEAVWPSDTDPPAALPDDAVEVLHQGERLGALSVAMPANDPMNPAKEKLVKDLAAQAGPVLRNVRLIEALRDSRRRLVTVQDEERRKLERNIHDGAQQQLVALAVQLKLADGLVERDPGKAHDLLEKLRADTNAALEDLRDLARGIYPPLLADQGLPAALEAQARKAAVPTTVEADVVGRFPQEIESAVYFSCLEALQNVAKYAEATRVTIALSNGSGEISFTVTDDGRGFDPSATGYGTGLQGIADRLAAIGGDLAVESTPGTGTTVAGRVRVGEATP